MESPVDFKNLYIKNLDIDIKSADLFHLFKAFGHVVSARVMSNPATGYSKGYGFVSYISPMSASTALQEMNGRMIGSKPLIVAFHEPKKPKLDKRMQSSPPEAWSPGTYGQGAYAVDGSDTFSIPPQSFQSSKRQAGSLNGTFLTSSPEMSEEPEDVNQVSERMRDLDIGQQAPESSTNEVSVKQTQQKPLDKPRSLASLASGTSISPSPQSTAAPTTAASPGYKVTPDGRPTLRRRNSLESVSSVVTETSAAIKHQKMTEAVMRCGDYGNKVKDIVDMLLTLKRKDRSLCLFNEEFLFEKIQLALEALEAFDEDEDDEDDEPVAFIPPSRTHRASTAPAPELSRNRATHRMSLPPNFAYIMPGNATLADIALPKRESKAIPIVAPPPEKSRAKPEIKTPSAPTQKEKGLREEIDNFLDSIKDKPIHEQKQQLGDRLFPLVKVSNLQ
jgi:hypothetical protein